VDPSLVPTRSDPDSKFIAGFLFTAASWRRAGPERAIARATGRPDHTLVNEPMGRLERVSRYDQGAECAGPGAATRARTAWPVAIRHPLSAIAICYCYLQLSILHGAVGCCLGMV
jgi:hypothetical protein